MKTLMLTVGLLAFGLASEAHAQWQPGVGGAGDSIAAFVIGAGVADGLAALGGVVAGTGTAIQAGRGANTRPWWVASIVMGALNAALAVLWLDVAGSNSGDNGFLTLGLAHGGIALFDIAMAAVGITHPPPVEPTIVGGVDASGKRWTGMGLQLASF